MAGPSPGNIYIGGLTTAEKVMAYNAIVEEGFNAPFDRPLDLVYNRIAAVKTPTDMRLPDGTVPTKVSFGFSPPNGKASKLDATGRQARPLTQHSIEVFSDVYTDTLYEERKVFQADVLGILKKVPRDLRRTESKNPDVLLASLLRNGKTATDYRGESFFATGKKCSPEGNVADTFANLFTGSALTEPNVAANIQAMMSIKGPDGLYLGVKPDTLIVPFSLWHDATVATQLKQIVFSSAPGQAANTAAVGDNAMAVILKWIKQIIVFPELQDGQSINNTTWYLADCLNDGPQGLCYALFEPAEYVSLMDPRDPNVFMQDKYFWGYRKAEGVNYGLPQYIARCEA